MGIFTVYGDFYGDFLISQNTISRIEARKSVNFVDLLGNIGCAAAHTNLSNQDAADLLK